jgi:DnaJ-class molecular chaperone
MKEINWNDLETERTIAKRVFETKKLPDGVYSCPACYGSGRVVMIYRDPGPNKYMSCGTCDGTGEIIKCKKEGCEEPVPNNKHWYPDGLCTKHERERIDTIMKNGNSNIR